MTDKVQHTTDAFYDTVAAKMVIAEVEIRIDWQKLANILGPKARKTKAGRSTALHGAVVVKYRGDRA